MVTIKLFILIVYSLFGDCISDFPDSISTNCIECRKETRHYRASGHDKESYTGGKYCAYACSKCGTIEDIYEGVMFWYSGIEAISRMEKELRERNERKNIGSFEISPRLLDELFRGSDTAASSTPILASRVYRPRAIPEVSITEEYYDSRTLRRLINQVRNENSRQYPRFERLKRGLKWFYYVIVYGGRFFEENYEHREQLIENEIQRVWMSLNELDRLSENKEKKVKEIISRFLLPWE